VLCRHWQENFIKATAALKLEELCLSFMQHPLAVMLTMPYLLVFTSARPNYIDIPVYGMHMVLLLDCTIRFNLCASSAANEEKSLYLGNKHDNTTSCCLLGYYLRLPPTNRYTSCNARRINLPVKKNGGLGRG
jgi:hypothetical protein